MNDKAIDEILELGSKAKLKMYHSLLSKVSGGKTLTQSELKVFDVLESELKQDQAERDTESTQIGGVLILSTTDTANFFDVTTRTLQYWAKAGCPNMGRGSWNLKSVHAWWLENIWLDKAMAESGDESMNEAKRLYWWQKATGEEIKNKQLQEELVAWQDIEIEWAGRVSIVTSGLEAFANTLPPILEGKPRGQMKDIIKQRVRLLRDAYARKGKYCPKGKAEKKAVKKAATKGKKSGASSKKN